jgi:hypothetical protein
MVATWAASGRHCSHIAACCYETLAPGVFRGQATSNCLSFRMVRDKRKAESAFDLRRRIDAGNGRRSADARCSHLPPCGPAADFAARLPVFEHGRATPHHIDPCQAYAGRTQPWTHNGHWRTSHVAVARRFHPSCGASQPAGVVESNACAAFFFPGQFGASQYHRRQTCPAPHTAHLRIWRLATLDMQTPPTNVLPGPHKNATCVVMTSG